MADSPFTHESLGRAIRAMLVRATGLDPQKVIPAKDNGPSPKGGVYVSVLIRSNGKIGTATVQNSPIAEDETKVLQRVTSSRLVRCSVNFYRKGAMDMAQALLEYPDAPVNQTVLALLGLTWHRVSDVRDLSALHGKRWEERAQLDLEIKVTRSTVAEVAAIDNKTIGVTVNETAESDLVDKMEEQV